MKKSFFFVAALAFTFAACNNNEPQYDANVATFENIELAKDTVLHLSETGEIVSGNFKLQQEVSVSNWGTYYFGSIVSNKTGKTYDYYADSDKSASGGAHSGKNFVVWTASYDGFDRIFLKEAAVVPGFYVNNTAWVVDAILNGDGMSDDGGAPFGADDYFTLTINAYLNGVAVNNEVKVDLAKGKSYIKDWTYVSLKSLGEVDVLTFTLTSSKKNGYGMTTPAYFCIDDLGAK